jgi:hypothetical protein
MSSTSDIGLGSGNMRDKTSNMEVTLKDVGMCLAAIEDIVRPLRKQVPHLTTTVVEWGH